MDIYDRTDWVDASTAARHLHVTPERLEQLRIEHRLLAVRFGDGCFYYPAPQFGAHGVMPALAPVLAVFAPVFTPVTITIFLSANPYAGSATTFWDLLRDLPAEDMIAWARRTVHHYR